MTFPPPPAHPGLIVDASGTGTYSIAAPRADRIEVCVLSGDHERRIALPHVDQGVHWGKVEGLTEGTHYGLRAYGPWDPERGLTFNPDHLLLDPYAHGLDHSSGLFASMFHHRVDSQLRPVHPRERATEDNRDTSIHSVVLHPDRSFMADDVRPAIDYADTVIYEAHVRGFSALNPAIDEQRRGTYAGMGDPASIAYLKDLGVTAVELLPIHAGLDEVHLTRLGLTNYWGYNTLSYFAPHPHYATAEAQAAGPAAVFREVQQMVKNLHRAGIEVIMDVVFNHTAEGDQDGPTVSLRGLDAEEYYWRSAGHLVDVTGTGNTLNLRSPHVVEMILRSLRFWVLFAGVDGFRFDLAATLGRSDSGFHADHPLLRTMLIDPVLKGTKLIAEPWDVGSFGWQTGNFPPGFSEWNDSYRDDVRAFWLSSARERAEGRHSSHGYVRDLATRLTASADIFRRNDPADLPAGRSLRAPSASVNFVTSHDGFTLHDLTAYNHKHNLANGEQGRDGTDNNHSFHHGTEGEDPSLDAARDRSARNLLATLVLSAGIPMLTAGDEVLRTQGGNNNAYCQDNEVSYLSWTPNARTRRHLAFTKALLDLRRSQPALRATRFFDPATEGERADHVIAWFGADGTPLEHGDWFDPGRHHLVALLPSETAPVLLILTNESGPHTVRLPEPGWLSEDVRIALDSSLGEATFDASERVVHLEGPTVVVLAAS
ncbi:MAG: glycogen debranching protein GlgX [Dermabacter sp.]|nr:glycogen debranching protein GlgX [Dermabacter sp.]